MGKFIDLTGKRFGKLIVLNKSGVAKNRQSIWRCRCDCGNIKNVIYGNLTSGYTRSCGCLLKENGCPPKHNLSQTRIYRIYRGMKNRCYNKKHKDYKRYGARGIKICNEWLKENDKGLLNFYNWAINNGYQDNLSIDRIDNNGNYEPGNCRWADNETQCNNKRNCYYITYNNKTYTVAKWSKILNICESTIRERIKLNFPICLVLYKGRISAKIKKEYTKNEESNK